LTSTRFRRRPSRPTGQPFRLASKDPLPGAKIEAAVGHSHYHGCAWRPMPLQVNLAGAVVPPVLGPAASGPASSLMKTLAVVCCAFTRVNTLFIIYHSHTRDGRGPGGDRPRPEQAQLNPTSTALLADDVLAKASRQLCFCFSQHQQ
jgi:hypothetical protein